MDLSWRGTVKKIDKLLDNGFDYNLPGFPQIEGRTEPNYFIYYKSVVGSHTGKRYNTQIFYAVGRGQSFLYHIVSLKMLWFFQRRIKRAGDLAPFEVKK